MAGLFDQIFGTAIPGLSGVFGLVEGLGAQDRAKRARERALQDMAVTLDRDYRELQQRNSYGLKQATGQAGDAISALGRNLGSSLAGAGVYNSSATAGTIANAQRSADTSLANQGTQNFYTEQDRLGQNQRFLSGLQYNLGNQQVGEANSQLQGAAGGISQFLGSLGQFNLAQSGAKTGMNGLSRIAGGPGNPGPASVTTPGGLYAGAFGGAPPATNYNLDFGAMGMTPGVKRKMPNYAIGAY